MAGLIERGKIRSTQQLAMSLGQFLREVFGEKLKGEVQKLHTWTPKGEPESFEYLSTVNVHRAAKWYVITLKLREKGYSFDLRFSAEIIAQKDKPVSLGRRVEERDNAVYTQLHLWARGPGCW